MANFDHLKNLEVTAESTADYTLYQVEDPETGKSPTLIVAPATDANAPYFNALLKRSRKYARQLKARNVSVDTLQQSRGEDKILYPRHVIKGWRDVFDSKGKPVKFSQEACIEFFQSIPDWIFEDIRTFAGDPTNFLDTDESIDAEAVGEH
jgi:hypothetical protein